MLDEFDSTTKTFGLTDIKHIMKLSTTFFLFAAAVATAAPTPTIQEPAKALEKRASITDAANIGYATTNGG